MALLVLATGNVVAQDPSHEVTDRFEATFEESEDINYDLWPDHWKRKTGRGFPAYTKIRIEPENQDQADGNHVLLLQLDGGRISLLSKPFQIDSRYSFHMHAKVKTSATAQHPCEAWYTISFYNADKKKIAEYKSAHVENNSDWNRISIGPILPPSELNTTAVVGLHLKPQKKTSLFGKAWFDDIWFARVPRIEIKSPNHFSVFDSNEEVELNCRLSGMKNENSLVHISLFDANRRLLKSESVQLGEASAQGDPRLERLSRNDYILNWKMPEEKLSNASQYGFYRLSLTLSEKDLEPVDKSKSFAVVARPPENQISDYGWSITDGRMMHDSADWKRLLNITNIGWLKMPVWDSLEDEQRATDIANLADRLAQDSIALIGVLDRPPESHALLKNQKSTDIAVLLREEKSWKFSVSPVLARLGLHIRWWQIGADHDHSLGDDVNAARKAKMIMKHFSQYGQHLRIGSPWLWLQQPAESGGDSWDFVEYSDLTSMTEMELDIHLKNLPNSSFQSWINLQPLPAEQYRLETRIRDLIARIITARRFKVPVVMMRPMDQESGILREDGSPTELFVPWKIITGALNQTQYLGNLQLPNGSTNRLFERDGHVMMFIWNDQPCNESIYLGKHVKALDVWGRRVALGTDRHRQVIPVSGMPILITNLDPNLARLRMSFQLDKDHLESIPGVEQPINIKLTNPFNHGLIGDIGLVDKQTFDKRYYTQLRTPPRQTTNKYLPIQLNVDAPAGRHMARFDFRLTTGEHTEFSVWRPLQIGDQSIEFQILAKVDKQNRMTLRALLINDSSKNVDFECAIYVPGQRKKTIDFFQAAPGISRRQLVIHQAHELKGKSLMFRAKEIDGIRTLNYRVPIEGQ